MKKWFWSYHVTYQPINKIKVTNVSGSPRGVIRVIKWRISIKTVEVSLSFPFLTLCQFPNLPIVFWESHTHKCVAFDANMQKKSPKPNFSWPFFTGSEFSFFGYLHWWVNWWRHEYESYFLIFKSSLQTDMLLMHSKN